MSNDPFSPKLLRREDEILGLSYTLETTLPWLSQVIGEARRASSFAAHVALQRLLAEAACQIRSVDRTIKAEIKRLQVKGEKPLDGQMAPEMRERVRQLTLLREANRRSWHGVRQVQDGIIWRLLRFDRVAIGTYGLGPHVTSLSNAFDREFAEAERRWEAGELAIFVDLASCANTGDLLICSLEEGSSFPVEVGSSRSGRKHRQQQAREARSEFVRSGRSRLLRPREVFAPAKRAKLETHLGELRAMFEEARLQLHVARRIGEHLFVVTNDARAHGREQPTPDDLRAAREELSSALPAAWSDDVTLSFDSVGRLRRDAKQAITTTAPYSIFPLDDETCAALCLGYARYQTILSNGEVALRLSNEGWEATLSETRGMWLDVTRIENQARRIWKHSVNRTLADQMACELVTLDAFTDLLREQFAIGAGLRPTSAIELAWAWSGEDQIWT